MNKKFKLLLISAFCFLFVTLYSFHNEVYRVLKFCKNNISLLLIFIFFIFFIVMSIINLYDFVKLNYLRGKYSIFDSISKLMKVIKLNIFSIVGYIVIIGIMLVANDRWCYLVGLLICAFNCGIINDELIKLIREALLKKDLSINKLTNEEIKKKANEKLQNKQIDINYRDKYIKLEGDIINYINKNYCMSFKQELKLSNKIGREFCPDGFEQKGNNIYFLDIKCNNTKNYKLLCEKMFSTTLQNIQYFEANFTKSFANFYNVLYFDNAPSKEFENKLKENYCSYMSQWKTKYDFKLYILSKNDLET